MSESHWRFNVNPVWENFSSLSQELYLAQHAKNDFFKYHHTKSALFFGIGTIESFLNQTLRKQLTANGAEEKEINNRLKAPLGRKLEKWPLELCGKEIPITMEFKEVLNVYKDIRNEVTHPTNKDHSIYKRIDEMEANSLKTLVAEYIISILETRGESFPYWLFGWNFIGMNADFNHPCLQDNYQFLWSLAWIGYRVPFGDCEKMDTWIKQNMTTLLGYREGIRFINKMHCEPKSTRYPSKPRLCNRWWDEKHVLECENPIQDKL